MKGLIKPLLILAVLAGALYVLNPTKDDFVTYLQNKAEAASGENTNSAIGNLISDGVGAIKAAVFTRDDRLFFSVYSWPASNPTDQYLGVAKFFIKTK
ncbi:MAG: hypothetical protein AB7T74_05455 [Clostridia bacterium]